VYLGHLPHGFYEEQLKGYFGQYGTVLGVKVGRSRKTARSKGYAFVQFEYAEVAEKVAETMNGYMLASKVLTSHTLPSNVKNPFSYSTSKKYKYINWKRIYMKRKNRAKTDEETHKELTSLLHKEKEKK
jgi:nucleolar protein 15